MLSEQGLQVEERLYFQALPSPEEIRKLAARLPGGVQDLVSTRGRRFKELGLAGQELSVDEWVSLLAIEPGLWRRPVAVRGDEVVVGFNQKRLAALATPRD